MAKYGSGNDETIITEYVELRETVEKNDLISRKQALELFTFNRLGDRIPEKDCDGFDVTIAVKDIKRMIRNLPTACEKEEQGVLVELPCKVGDTIWCLTSANTKIVECKVLWIEIHSNGVLVFCLDGGLGDVVLAHLNKKWFLTEEKAKQKLTELKGNRENE